MSHVTPNEIEVMVHYYRTPEPHPRLGAPAVREAIARFIREGMLERKDGACYTTARGDAWVRALRAVPFPDAPTLGVRPQEGHMPPHKCPDFDWGLFRDLDRLRLQREEIRAKHEANARLRRVLDSMPVITSERPPRISGYVAVSSGHGTWLLFRGRDLPAEIAQALRFPEEE